MIRFNNYSKKYGSQTILQIAELIIPNGVYWLKGINGSGKSTLLKSLSGLIPFSGDIHICNTNIQKQKKLHRQLVNYSEAVPVFPSFLSGMELIDFYVKTKQGNKTDCVEFCNQIALLATDLNKPVGSYSSGMLKKLSLALAFVGNAKWILLDEPLITLDVAATQVALQYFENYASKGINLLLTSHQDMDLPNHGLQLTTIEIKNSTIIGL
jgi:ABC-2 type transport system ATP-binding protein